MPPHSHPSSILILPLGVPTILLLSCSSSYSYLVAVYLPFLPPGPTWSAFPPPTVDRQPTSMTTTQNKNKSPFLAMSAGCIAGAIEATSVWPMEYIKVGCLLPLLCAAANFPSLVCVRSHRRSYIPNSPTLCFPCNTLTTTQNNNTDRHNCNSSPKPKAPSCPTLEWCQA
jgi:hypothetical protein